LDCCGALQAVRWPDGTHLYPFICLFSGMSENSLEAESGKTSTEDSEMDCEGVKKSEESASQDDERESVDDSRRRDDEVMYDVDIDSADENAEKSGDEAVPEADEAVRWQSAVTYGDSVENGGQETDRHVEAADTPEESGDSHTKVIFTVTSDPRPVYALPSCAGVHVAAPICTCCDGGGPFPRQPMYHWIDFSCEAFFQPIDNMSPSHSSRDRVCFFLVDVSPISSALQLVAFFLFLVCRSVSCFLRVWGRSRLHTFPLLCIDAGLSQRDC